MKLVGNAEIVFTRDWKEFVRGDLKCGVGLRLIYDNRRLPFYRATYAGIATSSIVAYITFKESPEVTESLCVALK
jgi:hypothetical protein